MAEAQNHARSLNPWILHVQKLGLELKCPSCLNLYNKPVLLPCDHILCDSCVPELASSGSACHFCNEPFVDRDLRQAHFVENIVNVYRRMDAVFSTHMHQPNMNDKCIPSAATKLADQLAKVPVDGSLEGNSSSEPSMFTLGECKRVHVSHYVKDKLMMNGLVNCGMPNYGEEKQREMCTRNPVFMTPCSQTRAMQFEQLEVVELEMNPSTQLSPDSYPSFDGCKGVDSDNDPSRADSAEKHAVNCSAKRRAENFVVQEQHDSCTSSAKGLASAVKKPKILHHRQPDMVEGDSPSTVLNCKTEMNPVCDINSQSFQKGPISDSVTSKGFHCEFCQTWRVTERTGPMLHYDDGKSVTGDDALHSDIIHVHQTCLEWAPQIYFEGGIVKNLKKELLRGGKLKCSKCGLKGAALGCYAKKCRRSYHAPCAVEIPECRWDVENYCMFCPSHSSWKFPSEKSKKRSKEMDAVPAQKNTQELFWEGSAAGAKQWILCGSALSADEKILLVKFASMCGATVVKYWNPNVTHVIAATDASGACTRTLKVLMAILKGRWILKISWIKACMEKRCPIDEEAYEVDQDNHGFLDGPKTGRLRTVNNVPKLFDGLKFYFSGDFVRTYKEDLQDLAIAAGGTILDSKEEVVEHMLLVTSTTLIVYNGDSMLNSGDMSGVKQRREAERVGEEAGSYVISHTWLLDSIAACKLQPFLQS